MYDNEVYLFFTFKPYILEWSVEVIQKAPLNHDVNTPFLLGNFGSRPVLIFLKLALVYSNEDSTKPALIEHIIDDIMYYLDKEYVITSRATALL